MDEFGTLLDQTIDNLALRRPVFHSEADFQHELAIELRGSVPECEIRLERPVRIETIGALNIDLVVRYRDSWYAIELKYLSRGLEATHSGEQFTLKEQGAQDIRRFDVIKDVWRLETVVAQGIAAEGYSITITNDSSFWREGMRPNTIDAAFRLHEGRTIQGDLAWAATAADGTTKGRNVPIQMSGSYELRWRDYSVIPETRNGLFRTLLVKVIS